MSTTLRLKATDFARVIGFDAATRMNRRTRKFNYLVPAKDGGVKIFTVAVRTTRENRTETKVVATQDPRRRKIWLRDVDFRGIAGWVVEWDATVGKLGGTFSWSFGCGAGFPFESVVNPEALDHTRYKYAYRSWREGEGVGLTDYLRLWERDPRVEYVAKAGLWKLVSPGGIRFLSRDRAFFEFVREHATEIRSGKYRLREIRFAMKRGVSLPEAEMHFKAVGAFAPFDGLPRAARERASKHLAWAKYLERGSLDGPGRANVFTLIEYARFLHYAELLGWDFRSAAVFPPREHFHEILERAEKEVSALRESRERNDFRDGMRAARERFGGICGMSAGGLSADVPFSREAFRQEGKAMKNCIGTHGYYEKTARGDSLVVFVRRDGKPAADMEIRLAGATPKLVQLYAERNREAPEDVEAFAKRILRHVRKTAKNF